MNLNGSKYFITADCLTYTKPHSISISGVG